MSKDEKTLIDIKDMEKNVTEKAREIWLAGLGALATAKEEGVRIYDSLIEKGEAFEKRGKQEIESLVDSVKEMAKNTETKVTSKVSETVEEVVKQTLNRFDIPSRDEVKNLMDKIDILTKKVEDLTKKKVADKAATN